MGYRAALFERLMDKFMATAWRDVPWFQVLREVVQEICAISSGLHFHDDAVQMFRDARGVAIRRQWLDPPREIARGDPVLVVAQVGGARLELECVAEAAGSTGQSIPVRNPVSGKRFTALVEGKGRASVGRGDL